MSAVESPSLYSIHPSVAYARAIVANLPEKTGRSLEAWLELLEQAAPGGEKERREWLKKEHGLGGTTAMLIAERSVGKGGETSDPALYLEAAAGYVEAMYAGAKSGLRPIHDHLIELARSLGADVKICPCKTIVPFYREHVFAEIKPATRTRIDLGLSLRGSPRPYSARLIETGGLEKGDRITHRIALAAPTEIDDEVREWLAVAYELAGKA